MTTGLQDTAIILHVFFGVAIPVFIYNYLYRDICDYSYKDLLDSSASQAPGTSPKVLASRRWLWALYYDWWLFKLFFLGLAELGYLYIFISVVCLGDWATGKVFYFFASSVFLFSSQFVLLYVHATWVALVTKGNTQNFERNVLGFLFITVGAAWCMVFSLDWNDALAMAASMAMAGNAMFVDLLWGVSWASNKQSRQAICDAYEVRVAAAPLPPIPIRITHPTSNSSGPLPSPPTHAQKD
jgi:hypothetical protein